MRWRPAIDRIEVEDTAAGKALRLCLSGVTGVIELNHQQADHLSDLLKAKP